MVSSHMSPGSGIHIKAAIIPAVLSGPEHHCILAPPENPVLVVIVGLAPMPTLNQVSRLLLALGPKLLLIGPPGTLLNPIGCLLDRISACRFVVLFSSANVFAVKPASK